MVGAMVDATPVLSSLIGRSGFVSVLAAAGSGKSTLLRQWEEADPRPFVWVASSDDPTAAASLRTTLANTTGPLVLVMDDAHRHPSVVTDLISTIATIRLAPGVAVVFSGRGLERRALSRLRLVPQMFEVSEVDLALDDASAARVLGPGVDADQVSRLVRLTGGWAAGLQLAGMAIVNGRMQADEFTGSDRLVRDYVAAEILDDLDADISEFLLQCAVFAQLSGPFCDAVLQTSGSAQRLETLERQHLFLSAVDREASRFRWNPLVREALAAEFTSRDPVRARHLRTVGAEWLAAHDAPQEALALQLSIGDREAALTLLADVVLPMFYGGHLDQIVGIIHELGPDIAVTHGYLATMFAYAGVMTGDHVCARRWAGAAEDYYRAHPFAELDEQVAFLTLRAHLCADGVRRMRLDAEAAHVRVKGSSLWRAPTLMLCGIAAGLCGDDAAAAGLLDEAIHVSRELDAGPALILALAEQIEFGHAQGLSLAAAVDAASDPSYAHYPHAALAWALQAEVVARSGDVDAARTALMTANRFRSTSGSELPWLGVQLRVHIARAMAALGDVAGARLVSGEIESLLQVMSDPGVLGQKAQALAVALRRLPAQGNGSANLLTAAELRLLPMLVSHLSFAEIGARLHLSRNTVKTQAASVYRKLGASSRSGAVEHAARLGLVDA